MAGDPNKADGIEDMPGYCGGPHKEATTKFYIKADDLGYFVGECLGLGFFESHIDDGTLDPCERPCEFDSREDAQQFLDRWVGGGGGCYVTDILSERAYDD